MQCSEVIVAQTSLLFRRSLGRKGRSPLQLSMTQDGPNNDVFIRQYVDLHLKPQVPRRLSMQASG